MSTKTTEETAKAFLFTNFIAGNRLIHLEERIFRFKQLVKDTNHFTKVPKRTALPTLAIHILFNHKEKENHHKKTRKALMINIRLKLKETEGRDTEKLVKLDK